MTQELMVQARPQRNADSVSVPGYAWVILLVVFLMSVAAPLSLYKVPPLMPVLMDAFQMDLRQAGLLMSVFAITGMILGLPAGLILQRLGPKVTGLAAMACIVLGAVMGALANTAVLLLASRVIEGIGMGLISVIAPAIIAMWFPAEKRGAPMGIWATWVPVGSVLMYNLAPALASASGWQSVWWFSAGFALAALLLFAWLMRLPDASTNLDQPQHNPQMSLGRAMANRNIWLLALSFGCFNLVFLGFGTFYPTFLSEVRGYPLSTAAFIASLSTIMILGSAPVAGWLSDRLGTRKWLLIIPTLLIAGLMLLPFRVEGSMLYAFMILMGLIVGAIPTATFSAVPEIMERPEQAGFGMAILSVGQNAGMVIGPMVFGGLVDSIGWVPAGYWMLPVCALALIATVLIKVR